MIEDNGTNRKSVDPSHGDKSYVGLSPATASKASLVTSSILEYFRSAHRSGDVTIIFSNGDFGGLHGKLVAQLEAER